MEDRLLIRELYGAYSDATCQADADAWLALWTADGVRSQDGREVTGHDELRQFWAMIFGAVKRMAFFTELGAVDVTADRATARCYCREIVTLKSGELIKIVGIYDDQLARVDGSWRFARRDYQVFIDEGIASAT
jgi:ketosteroid isomerase-like protein